MLLGLLVTTPRSAWAEEPTDVELAAARRIFGEGLDLEKAGDSAGALDKFEKVARIKMTPQVRYHVALCQERLGRLVEALNGFELAAQEAKAAGPKAQEVADNAPARAAALRAQVGQVHITASGTVRTSKILLDGKPVSLALLDTDIPVDPGKHLVQVDTGGKIAFEQELQVEKGQVQSLELPIDDPEPPPRAAAGPASPAGPEQAAPPAEPAWKVQLPAYLVGGAGLLVAAGGGVLWGLREVTVANVRETCTGKEPDTGCDPEQRGTAELGHTYDLASKIAFGVGGAAVVSGVVLWFVLRPGEEGAAKAASLGVAPLGVGAQLVGRF
ncbi:MAG: hypothetical protein HY744_31110 [Deltaproteobacteria bacterium]|nr:hypothetical protein [Deltaproteobacteria bacterium]